jgi:hypothetical protein
MLNSASIVVLFDLANLAAGVLLTSTHAQVVFCRFHSAIQTVLSVKVARNHLSQRLITRAKHAVKFDVHACSELARVLRS